jgi:UDP-glucose:(heptosyl)LPS alpha-1,3-glucosyltransferase
MHVALIIFRADPQRGGAERYTADIAAALVARGHQVHLLSTHFGPPIPGVNFVSLSGAAPTKAGQYRAFLNSLDEHLASKRYDVVHSMLPVRRCDIYHPHAGMAKAALQTHLARETVPARALASFANRLNRKRRFYAQVEDALLHGPARPIVLCLSDYVKGMILNHYPDIGDQLTKLFNATNLNDFDPEKHSPAREAVRARFHIPPEATVALMIAQHFERKGLADVIAATHRLWQKSPEIAPIVLVVGQDDPSRSRLHARRLGIADRIIFAGTTDRSADFYAAGDFFVLPTRHDSCSLVVLEALAMGMPVISTVFNGACEIMIDGRHGFILPDPADVTALTDAMSRLLDPAERQRMRQACLALRPSLSFEAHLDRLEEIYHSRGRAAENPRKAIAEEGI